MLTLIIWNSFDLITNRYRLRIFFLVSIISLILNYRYIYPQNTQFWWDYKGYLLDDINWDYELNVGFSHLFTKDGWFNFYLNNKVEYQKLQWLLLDGSFELHYIKDPQYLNYIEIRN